MNFVAFGIGNFHFSLSDSWVEPISYGDYLEEVVRTLGQLEFVGDIDIGEVSNEEHATPINDGFSLPYPRSENGDIPHPKLLSGGLSFVMRLPFARQATILCESEEYVRSALTESIRIHIKQGDLDHSATFVECLNAHKGVKPSLAVQVARMALEQEIAKVRSHVVFEWAPPIQTNCLLSESAGTLDQNQSPLFTCAITPGRIEDFAHFRYNPKKFSCCENAKEMLFFQLTREVGFFYYTLWTRKQLMQRWVKLEETIGDLAAQKSGEVPPTCATCGNQMSRVNPRIFSIFPADQSKLVNKARYALWNLETREEVALDSLNRMFRNMYNAGGFLKEFTRRAIDDIPRYPCDKTRKLIDFLDRKWSQRLRMGITILVALISAGASIIATVLLIS